MGMKTVLLFAILAATTFSANARRGSHRRSRFRSGFDGRPGREGQQMGGPWRGAPPMGGRGFDGPGPLMDGPRQGGPPTGSRRFDGPGPITGGRRSDGPPMGSRRFDGPGQRRDGPPIEDRGFDGPRFDGFRPRRPSFGLSGSWRRNQSHDHLEHHHGPSRDHAEGEPFGQRNNSSEEDGRPHPHHHHHHHPHHNHHHHRNHHHHGPRNETGHNSSEEQDHDRPTFEMKPFRFFKDLWSKPFSEGNGRPHPHHHHHHHGPRNESGHNSSEEQDRDRPTFEMKPFSFFKDFWRNPFGGRPFGRRNQTEEDSGRWEEKFGRHRHPHGHRGRWGDSEESEEEVVTDTIATTAAPEEVEIDLNEIDNNIGIF